MKHVIYIAGRATGLNSLMLCDVVQPLRDPKIGRIKGVAAGATAVTEIGGAIVVGVLLWPHLWAALHR